MRHNTRRIKCDVCGGIKSTTPKPPKGIPQIRCRVCVRDHGWPDPLPVGPLHTRPLEDRMRDPDVRLFHDELAAWKAKQDEDAIPHVPTRGNFRRFVV